MTMQLEDLKAIGRFLLDSSSEPHKFPSNGSREARILPLAIHWPGDMIEARVDTGYVRARIITAEVFLMPDGAGQVKASVRYYVMPSGARVGPHVKVLPHEILSCTVRRGH